MRAMERTRPGGRGPETLMFQSRDKCMRTHDREKEHEKARHQLIGKSRLSHHFPPDQHRSTVRREETHDRSRENRQATGEEAFETTYTATTTNTKRNNNNTHAQTKSFTLNSNSFNYFTLLGGTRPRLCTLFLHLNHRRPRRRHHPKVYMCEPPKRTKIVFLEILALIWYTKIDRYLCELRQGIRGWRKRIKKYDTKYN